MNNKILKKIPKTLICLFMLFSVGYSVHTVHAAEPAEDEVAARVNGVVITRQAVKREAAVLPIPEPKGTPQAQEEAQRRRSRIALDNLITEELMYQEAVARGVKVDEDKVHDVIRQMKETMPGGEFTKLAFTHWAVKDEILKVIERDLMVKKLYKEVVLDQAVVTEDELLQFYKTNQELFQKDSEVRLQQILLFAGPGAEQAELLRNTAETIASRARGGEDFVALARNYSLGPARDLGGDLGWRSVNHLPEGLSAAVTQAEVGTIIGPVSMPGGYIIAKVLDKQISYVVPFTEAREHLAQTLREKKLQAKHISFLQGLRTQAEIEILPP